MERPVVAVLGGWVNHVLKRCVQIPAPCTCIFYANVVLIFQGMFFSLFDSGLAGIRCILEQPSLYGRSIWPFLPSSFCRSERGAGGRKKGWRSLFLNPVRGSNYFLCHPLLTWQTLHIFINVDQARYLTVSVYVYLFYVFAKRLPVLNITASIVTVKELVMEDASCWYILTRHYSGLDSIILPEFLSLIFRTVLQRMEAFLQSPSKDKETRQWL